MWLHSSVSEEATHNRRLYSKPSCFIQRYELVAIRLIPEGSASRGRRRSKKYLSVASCLGRSICQSRSHVGHDHNQQPATARAKGVRRAKLLCTLDRQTLARPRAKMAPKTACAQFDRAHSLTPSRPITTVRSLCGWNRCLLACSLLRHVWRLSG